MKLSNDKFTTDQILEFLDNLEGSYMVGRSTYRGGAITFIPTDRIGMAGFSYFTLGRSKDNKVIIGKSNTSTYNMFGVKFNTLKEAAERFNEYAKKHFLI